MVEEKKNAGCTEKSWQNFMTKETFLSSKRFNLEFLFNLKKLI